MGETTKTVRSNKGTSWGVSGALGTKDMYKLYRKTNDNPVSYTKYSEILRDCNKEFMSIVITEGREVRMPYMSTLYIKKTKNSKFKTLDYNKFNVTGEISFLENDHSEGYLSRFQWTKSRMPIVGKTIYSLKIARDNCRRVAQEMKKFNGHTKYTEYGR